jgi:hypothetical protein
MKFAVFALVASTSAIKVNFKQKWSPSFAQE